MLILQAQAWLKCKVQQVMNALSQANSQYSTMDAAGLQRYAIELLGEYLSAAWVDKLRGCYPLPEGQSLMCQIAERCSGFPKFFCHLLAVDMQMWTTCFTYN